MENLNEGKKSNYMAELAEIDKQSALVALEAKINKLAEMAEAKTNRLSMVHEDENLSELISKQAVKEMQRSIKEIEKLKEKLLKEFTKKGGKMTEVIDETEEVAEEVVAEETVEEEIDEASCGSTYEEDDIEEGIEAELEKNKGVTWDEAEPAQVAKEKLPTLNKEEVTRWQKLAGVSLNEQQEFKSPGLEQAYDNLEKSVVAWRKATMPMGLQKEEEFKAFETAYSKMIQAALAKDVRAN